MNYKGILFLVLGIGLTAGARGQQTEKAEEPFLVQTFKPESVQVIKAETQIGDISIVGGPVNEARLEVYVAAYAGSQQPSDRKLTREVVDELLKDYSIAIGQEGNRLRVDARSRKACDPSDNRYLSVSLRFTVPYETSTDLRTNGGSVTLKAVHGQHLTRTSGGSLQMEEVSGSIEARTSGGGVELVDCHDSIDLMTSGGAIDAQHSQGDFKLRSAGGAMILADLLGVVDVRTGGGNLRAERLMGEIAVSTSGGNARFREVGGSFRAVTNGGKLEIDGKTTEPFLTHTSTIPQ